MSRRRASGGRTNLGRLLTILGAMRGVTGWEIIKRDFVGHCSFFYRSSGGFTGAIYLICISELGRLIAPLARQQCCTHLASPSTSFPPGQAWIDEMARFPIQCAQQFQFLSKTYRH